MSVRPRPRVLLTIFAVGVLAGACTPRSASRPARRTASPTPISLDLPAALPLPRRLPAYLYLSRPRAVEATIQRALDEPNWSIRTQLREGLAPLVTKADLQRITAVCDPERPWHAVALSKKMEIFSAYVAPSKAHALTTWLNTLPKAGNFGARQLRGASQASDRSPLIIWTGPSADRVLLAPSLRALVTALELKAPATPIRVAVSPQQLSPWRRAQLEIPAEIRELRAAGQLEDLSVDLHVDRTVTRDLAQLELAAPTLPQLLRDASLVWSGTTTWTGARAQVRELLAQVRREVRDLPFLIRPTAEHLEQRLIAAAKEWNGQSFVGLDRQQTLRLAMGVQSLQASQNAVLGLIQATIPNLQLMRNFSSSVPSARLLQQRAQSHGQKVHELILSDVSDQLPRDFHILLSRRRQLHVALSWSSQNQALLICAGPNAVSSMLSWIDATHRQSELFARPRPKAQLEARSTLPATLVREWLERGTRPSMAELLRVRPATPPQDYVLSLTQNAEDRLHLDLRVQTPDNL